jgi:hypothetical protein
MANKKSRVFCKVTATFSVTAPRRMPFRLTLWLLLVAPAFAFGQAEEPAKYAAEIVRRHGGPERLLKVFRMEETFSLNGGKKNTDRTSFLQPPALWYVGQTERVSESGKGSVCQDIWMWTLAPLADPQTKLAAAPDAVVAGRQAHALKVSGTIEPAIVAYFDAETYGLVRIDWKGQQFVFSQPKDFDGTRVPTRCVLYGKDGKERMRTDLRSITRLAQLPAGLPAPK